MKTLNIEEGGVNPGDTLEERLTDCATPCFEEIDLKLDELAQQIVEKAVNEAIAAAEASAAAPGSLHRRTREKAIALV